MEVLSYRPPCLTAFNTFLLSLVVMHVYWFALILLVAYRRVALGEIEDSRED